jgi:hypothetical protein
MSGIVMRPLESVGSEITITVGGTVAFDGAGVTLVTNVEVTRRVWFIHAVVVVPITIDVSCLEPNVGIAGAVAVLFWPAS